MSILVAAYILSLLDILCGVRMFKRWAGKYAVATVVLIWGVAAFVLLSVAMGISCHQGAMKTACDLLVVSAGTLAAAPVLALRETYVFNLLGLQRVTEPPAFTVLSALLLILFTGGAVAGLFLVINFYAT